METTKGTFSFMEFIREGGWGMWPILLLGVVTLACAARHVVRPTRHGLAFIGALWVALAVAVVHATILDVSAVFHYLEDPLRAPDGQVARTLMTGLKESSRPAALGGIFLTLAPLLVAAGLYREWVADRRAA